VIKRNSIKRYRTTVNPSVIEDDNDVDHPGRDHPSRDVDHPGRDVDHPGRDVDHPSRDVDHTSRDVDHPSSVADEEGNEKILDEADDEEEDGDALGSSETKKTKEINA